MSSVTIFNSLFALMTRREYNVIEFARQTEYLMKKIGTNNTKCQRSEIHCHGHETALN